MVARFGREVVPTGVPRFRTSRSRTADHSPASRFTDSALTRVPWRGLVARIGWKLVPPPDARPGYSTRPAAAIPGAAFADDANRAGFWLRLAAYVIDTILFLIGFFVLVGILGPLGLVLAIVGVWLYYAGLESSDAQATLGKRAMGIIVTDLLGERLTFGRATGRFAARIVTGLIPFAIGYIMAGFTKHKQALHDMIASTLVIVK